MKLPRFHPDYIPSGLESEARHTLHDVTGEHWWVNCEPRDNDGEARVCRVCRTYKGFRGPGG